MSRVLLLTPNTPYPTDSGGAQRTFLLYQALRQRYEVDLVLVNDDVLSEEARQILTSQFNLKAQIYPDGGGSGPRQWTLPVRPLNTVLSWLVRLALGSRLTLFKSPAMSTALSKVLDEASYSAIVCRYMWPASQTGAYGRVPVFVDVDDLPSETWLSQAASAKRRVVAWMGRWVAQSYAAGEQRELQSAAGVWVVKDKDMSVWQGRQACLLPNMPFAAYPDGVRPLPVAPADKPVVIGVGLFDWEPNKKGFDWFVRQVWPKVHQQIPVAELHLVGKLTDTQIAANWKAVPGVRYLGRVADLEAQYRLATIAVAPIFAGGGTNIKVIEALAMGRPCVVSPHAAKGFEQLKGLHVAADESVFANACVSLLKRPEGIRIEEAGEASVAANQAFSFDGFASAVLAVMDLTTTGRSIQ